MNTCSRNPNHTTDTIFYAAVLLIIGIVLFVALLGINAKLGLIERTDGSAYAEQARSIIDGKGNMAGYVINYFYRYPSVFHDADIYPPGNPALIALAFMLFGKTDIATVIPTLIIALLLLPLTIYLLGISWGASPLAAFFASLCVVFQPYVSEQYLLNYSDIPFMFVITLAVLLIIAGGRKRMFLCALAGILVAASFYARYVGIVFALGMCLLFIRREGSSLKVEIKPLWIFLVCAVAGMAPWLIRNYLYHDKLIYSVQGHVGATLDYVGSDRFWRYLWSKVWWADSSLRLPTGTNVVALYGIGHVARVTLNRLFDMYFEWPLLTVAFFGGTFIMRKRRHTIALFAMLNIYMVFICLTYHVVYRYLFLILPFASIFGWAALERVLDRSIGKIGIGSARWKNVVARIICAGLFIGIFAGYMGIVGKRLQRSVELRTKFEGEDAAIGWIKNNTLPNDIVMTNLRAYSVRYYTNALMVQFPTDDPDKVEQAAKYYRVKYILIHNSYILDEISRYFEAYSREWDVVANNKYFTAYKIKSEPRRPVDPTDKTDSGRAGDRLR